jgi:hypothetical protein
MSNISHPSTIESLPTELWCEVFEFFDAIELYHTFGNLNSKITSILSESIPLYFKIGTTTDYDFSSRIILPTVNNLANVKSVKFDQEFQIEEFFTIWPISGFSQLRCLSLVYLGALMSDCSILLLEQLSTLTHFECLRIRVGCIANYDKCLKRLLQLIFIENQVFHSLKHFVFQSYPNSNFLALPTTGKPTNLKSIALPSISLDQLVQLFPSIPHIKYIKINYLFVDLDTIAALKTPSSNSALPNLVELNLQLNRYATFEYIEFLLQQVPNVNQLKFKCHYCLINGNKWEMLLARNCSKLQKFELMFFGDYFDALPIFIEIQSSFSTTFWIERNVQLEHSEETRHLLVRFKV